MVKRLIGALCALGLLLGATGCAGQRVDLVGEWVYENPVGGGAARISIEDDGTFSITGWPSNLQIGRENGSKAVDEGDLNWDEPLSFSGKLENTEAEKHGGVVYFSSSEDDPWLNFNGYPGSECIDVLIFCFAGGDKTLKTYLNGADDEFNYVAFVRESE